jgi:hypothetical protein
MISKVSEKSSNAALDDLTAFCDLSFTIGLHDDIAVKMIDYREIMSTMNFLLLFLNAVLLRMAATRIFGFRTSAIRY